MNKEINKIRVLFMGTGEFALPSLQILIAEELFEVVGVVTQPSKPYGRKQRLKLNPVKQFLTNLKSDIDFKIYEPSVLRVDAVEILEDTKPDIIVVAAYGQMIPTQMLDLPKFGALNIHGSLLPELRGAVPVHMAILQGLTETGVTIQVMRTELDAGPILAKKELKISTRETTPELMDKLARIGADLLNTTISSLVKGEIEAIEQDHSLASYCYQSDISKEKAEILSSTKISQVEKMVRALLPWPVAWFYYSDDDSTPKRIQIFKAFIPTENFSLPAFSKDRLRILRHGKRLFLHLEDGVLELEELQLEGKRRMAAHDYLFLADDKIELLQ